MKTGSAYYAPASAVVQMIESMTRNQRRILPCSVRLEGEYGYNDIVLGVPAVLGKNGVEKVLELKLNSEEKALMDKSAQHVEQTVKEAMELINK